MKGAEELGEILFECSKQHDKVIDWWNQHKDDVIFTTDEGNKLRQHLGGMLKEEALAMLKLSAIELNDALQDPEVFISKETFDAFKEAMQTMEGV